MHRTPLSLLLLLLLPTTQPLRAELVERLGLQAGTVVVTEAPSYSGWSAVNLIDVAADSGWASETGKVSGPHVFVFELATPATFTRFEFDTAAIDGDGRGARDARIEVSADGPDRGYVEVARATLADRADGQVFAATRQHAGRWVRLTLTGNHGDPEWSELMGIRGLAEPAPPAPPATVSGTYESDYSTFHLRQQGTALVGCYEYDEGLLTGTIEGRVMKLWWRESSGEGPAVMTFAEDGRSFRGHWWSGNSQGAPAGAWNGRKLSSEVGGCPHWSGSLAGELERGLADTGRARLSGVLFDSGSAVIRAESKPVLDEVARLLRDQPAWSVTVEGHTDSQAAEAYNQNLSSDRAAAVVAYLTAQGIAADRLTAVGFGESRPVADNDTELGRAQNRRVELVRR